ncbi:MAG: alpha/beta fold hydrolase [Acidithiobacillus sp.]|uniref:alpha/beta fold hydrolase n=1 Tax=Acidithiobacillus sp. TaxID=1872118 RepID=UPI00258A36A7|nr:alpha/beta fold hydrolase [Acidithiobacillus sp.]MCE5387633.1 alpha/beta fold hydrolase [Acidithiobacillus sp.]MCE5419175.1 alpha/beta fold hydrolase [Acidithiobacillus sp.]
MSTAKAPLLLLHGWAMESRIFSTWINALAGDFRCQSWDLPGHGGKPCPPQGLDWEDSLLTLQGTVQALSRPIVLGWSLGGLFALALALRFPELLGGLVLIDSSPCFVQREDWPWALTSSTLDAFAHELLADGRAVRRRFLALQTQGDPAARAQLAAAQRWPLPDPRCLLDGLQLLRDKDLRPQLRPLPFPVLILQGEVDRIVPPAAAKQLQSSLAGSRLQLLKAGHAPFLSHPEACSQALRSTFYHD